MTGDKKFDDKYLKKNGIDAHEVKDDYGCKPVSHYDLYCGETVTIKDKKGKVFADTGMSKDEFFAVYGNEKEGKNRWKTFSILA